MTVTIYHNPRCTKSRLTLELLREKGYEPNVVEYLTTPPNKKELQRILSMLQMAPRELMRTKEPEYKTYQVDDPSLDENALIEKMVAHPKLIERPIVVIDGKAAIGRPPENVLDILA